MSITSNGCLECHLDGRNTCNNGHLVYRLYTKDGIYGDERWEQWFHQAGRVATTSE